MKLNQWCPRDLDPSSRRKAIAMHQTAIAIGFTVMLSSSTTVSAQNDVVGAITTSGSGTLTTCRSWYLGWWPCWAQVRKQSQELHILHHAHPARWRGLPSSQQLQRRWRGRRKARHFTLPSRGEIAHGCSPLTALRLPPIVLARLLSPVNSAARPLSGLDR